LSDAQIQKYFDELAAPSKDTFLFSNQLIIFYFDQLGKTSHSFPVQYCP
jgi:hypothetical protein